MARTYNDIYYNDDENSTAEILDDMKKLAESVDQQIGSIKSFNNDTSQFIEQVTPLMNTLSEQVIDMHQLADTMFTELEQVKEENKQLREDLNGLPKGQASGESIDLSDSAEMRCELKISGNSVQDGEPTPDEPVEVECCGDNINIFDGEVEEGNIDASTGKNAVATNAWRSKNYLNVKDTSVSISVKDLTFSGTVGRLYFYKSDNTYISNILINSLPFTATLPNETAKVRFFILNSVADINAKIKLEKGSTVTPYSPYGQGCINEVICNDNLFDKNNLIPYTVIPRSNGVAITNNSSNYEPYNATDFIPVKENTNYFINFTFASTNYGWCFYDKNKNFISGIEPNVKSFATPKETAYLRFCYDKNRIDTNTIQLVEGSTEKPYVEHKEQIYTIPTQQPFRAIDNIRDTFIKKNNKWYERHYEVEIIVDGTETINKSSSKEFFAISKTTSNIDTSANAVNVSKSNYGTGTTLGLGEGNTNNKYSFNASTIYLDCYGSNINTVDKLKAQLAETPMKIYALLKEPLDIECTEEQSTILDQIENEAKTYKNVTHMYSTDNVSSYKEVTYKKDIETLFENTLVEGV